jgi:hypothetical protein
METFGSLAESAGHRGVALAGVGQRIDSSVADAIMPVAPRPGIACVVKPCGLADARHTSAAVT